MPRTASEMAQAGRQGRQDGPGCLQDGPGLPQYGKRLRQNGPRAPKEPKRTARGPPAGPEDGQISCSPFSCLTGFRVRAFSGFRQLKTAPEAFQNGLKMAREGPELTHEARGEKKGRITTNRGGRMTTRMTTRRMTMGGAEEGERE